MIFWIITSVIFFLISAILAYYCISFGITILKVQDVLEESLDVIEEKHQKISEILERPLFYDSPEVRTVLSEIAETKVTLHRIAYALSSNFNKDKSD